MCSDPVHELESFVQELLPLELGLGRAVGSTFPLLLIQFYLEHFVVLLEGEEEKGSLCKKFEVNLEGADRLGAALCVELSELAADLCEGRVTRC